MGNNTQLRPRIIVADFHQETNSFNPATWGFDAFRQDTFLEGEAIERGYGTNSGRVLCGILEQARQAGAEIIPACALRATSGGPVEQAVVDYFLSSLLRCYEQHAPVDAFVMSLHGATQSTQYDDVCGYILQQLRRVVGPETCIGIGCDMHANITQTCMENADYICGFQTYPHVDQKETGARVTRLVLDALRHGEATYSARVYLPMIVPASGYSTDSEPLRSIMAQGHRLCADGTLLDFSVFQMQPWLDVRPAGSTVLTIAREPEAARTAAAHLARQLFDSRESFWPKLYTQTQVIDLARQAPAGKPVILVDFADSLGAGAPGTSASVLHTLQQAGWPVRTAMLLTDPQAVAQARQLGPGKTGRFRLGQDGVEAEAFVRSLSDGVFFQQGPVGAGQRRDLGSTALLQIENVDVLVCQHACGTGDLQVYRGFGVEPTAYQMVVVKANTSFRASYAPIASHICMTDTPGIGTANLTSLHYRHIPRHFYPFASMQDYEITPPELFRHEGSTYGKLF